jgi:tRNA-specific 2-thiouridylase
MVTPEGRIVGTHMGLMYYTIGQRQGLGIGGEGLPWYVCAKDLAANRLIVVQGHEHPSLKASALVASDLSWIATQAPHPERAYAAKTRYRQADAPCRVTGTPGGMEVVFDAPQWAITPGQSVVIYEGEVCLGGGVIERALAGAALPAAA